MKFIKNTTCYINFVNRTCGQEEIEATKGGNQNPYIKEEETTQWSKEKVQTFL